MKRKLPLIIVLVTGIFGVLTYIIPHPIIQDTDAVFRNDILRVIGAFSIVLGIGSILRHHFIKIKRKAEHWGYSWITVVALFVSAIIGLFGGIDPTRPGLLPTQVGGFSFHIQSLFTGLIVPLGSTMFALLAFFMASAAYRAFRARNLEATLLLVSAFILMLGAVPLTRMIVRELPSFAEWILAVPNTAAKRGIGFGISLGILATSLKIILGIERGWLGGGE
ncbi:hypothetical protein FJY68_01020 [candidate division WOR-3 bacterium]|uniref:Uncharacterized protein n=1 Tax=candidate division WOR-3 bacterium TaxID=2052148 RepID=A0A937XF09_UNCW3|nr:hypothetical protein [candidate division WOR-3 bacterium]